MNIQDEFNQIPEDIREKVIKKINKIYRWIGHAGGFNEVWLYALTMIVFKAHDDMGLDITVTPRGQENSSIIITDPS